MPAFDPVDKIRELDRRLLEVERTIVALVDEVLDHPNLVRKAPYATTDAGAGPTLDPAGTRLVESVEAGSLGDHVLARLRAAGYGTVESIRDAFDEELLAIDGIGPKTLKQIRLQIG